MRIEESALPADLFFDLDRNGPVPLYFQVSSRLEQAILDGRLPPGSRLENELSLSSRLYLSRPTIRRAIQELVGKGLLVRRRGIGTQVVHGKVTRNVELTSLFEDLTRDGRQPTTEVLALEEIEADQMVADALGVQKNSRILHIRRVRSADDVPVAVLENFLPVELGGFDRDQLAQHGLYQLMRSTGTTLQIAKQKIGARRATSDEEHELQLDKHSPVLSVERITYDNSGRAVELGLHCYRPDLYSFEVTMVAK